jgi:hypothetical protein
LHHFRCRFLPSAHRAGRASFPASGSPVLPIAFVHLRLVSP